MNRLRVALCLAATPLFAVAGTAYADSSTVSDTNLWPIKTEHHDAAADLHTQTGLGPFIQSAIDDKGAETFVFRPFYLYRSSADGRHSETNILYPLFFYRSDGDHWRWSIFNLINRSSPHANGADAGDAKGFDIWPFWFSRDTGTPDSSYKALFPIQGPMKHRLGYERIDWTLFPLYFRLEDTKRASTYTPWPFFKRITGTGTQETGWALWPIAGHRAEPGKSHTDYALWPLIYSSTTRMDEPVPIRREGFLPFYARASDEGYHSAVYLWPFFGWSERTVPYIYKEQRYLYPLWVQGSGNERTVNRWAPFYTHSVKNGQDKTWVLWPLWREAKWREAGLDQRKSQFLYFVYWNLEQRRPGASESAPTASKTHLWPLLSHWDNGAGRTQTQILSPIEVFLQHNEQTRLLWSPFFALYRSETQAPGISRGSLLWNAVTWSKDTSAARKSFRLGPLYASDRSAEASRIALLGGLLAWHRDAKGTWAFTPADFRKTPASPETHHP